MIFEQERIALSVMDVLSIDQTGVRYDNHDRHFSALSFRYPDSEATISVGGKSYDVSGTVAYFPAHMNYTRVAKHDHLLVIHFEDHTYFENKLELFRPQEPERYRILFERALAVWNSGEPSRHLTVTAILYEILALAYRENLPSGEEGSLLTRAVAYIEKNCFRTDFSVSEIAEALYVSETYLRRLFRAHYGESPKAFITRRRIARAISLLQTQYYPVSEIAELCGFRDPRHFSTVFHKAIGCAPSEYRYDFHM